MSVVGSATAVIGTPGAWWRGAWRVACVRVRPPASGCAAAGQGPDRDLLRLRRGRACAGGADRAGGGGCQRQRVPGGTGDMLRR
ncbi:hypothetical protein NUM3379_35390 [Kineococcus sp. NUM-3379]